MIWIFHRERADAGSCENYEDLFQYISHKEDLKLREDHPEFGQPPWSFEFFTPQQASTIYANIEQSLLTEIVKEADEKEMGFIAIFQGDFKDPIEILGMPDIDIEAIKKQWCLAYCDAHDYIIVENFSHHSSDFAQSQWQLEAARFSNYPLFAQGED